MKKFLLLASITATVLLTSCITKEYYNGDDYLTSKTHYKTVYPNEWHIVQTINNCIFATVMMPDITTDVIENGVVLVYFLDEYDNLLPYIRSYAPGLIEIIRYDIADGYITFIIENHEGSLPYVSNNELLKFKIVIIK